MMESRFSGFEVCKRVRENPACKNTPIIGVSEVDEDLPASWMKEGKNISARTNSLKNLWTKNFSFLGKTLHSKNETEHPKQRAGGYPIGVVSKTVDLSQKTIRDYEKMGLIKPKREPRTNNRIYSDFEIEQIQHITHLIHKEGFTLRCLQRILQLAPCWNIFDCRVKERCPAYQNSSRPCYETRNQDETLCSGSCEQCAIFINRFLKKEKVLERPEDFQD
jgi:DNA-binding transcriptional MerR regulator